MFSCFVPNITRKATPLNTKLGTGQYLYFETLTDASYAGLEKLKWRLISLSNMALPKGD